MGSTVKRRTSILTRILLACLLPAAIVFIALLYMTTKTIYKEASDSARDTAAMFSDYVTQMVRTAFFNANGSIAMMSENLAIIDKKAPHAKTEADDMLRMFLSSSPNLYCSWFAFEPGVFGVDRFAKDYIRKDKGITELFDLTSELLADAEKSPWYNGALKSGKPYFDSVGFYDYGEGPTAVFTVSVPIKHGNKVVGVVGMDALYSEFYRFIDSFQAPGSREIMLLAVDGRILYSTRHGNSGKTIFDFGFDEYRDELLSAFAKRRYEVREQTSPIFGKPSLMSVYPVELEGASQPIFLFVDQPTDILFAKAHNLATAFGWAGAAMAAVVGVSRDTGEIARSIHEHSVELRNITSATSYEFHQY